MREKIPCRVGFFIFRIRLFRYHVPRGSGKFRRDRAVVRNGDDLILDVLPVSPVREVGKGVALAIAGRQVDDQVLDRLACLLI